MNKFCLFHQHKDECCIDIDEKLVDAVLSEDPIGREPPTTPHAGGSTSATRHAETEALWDQPYEDNKRIRVCGPCSVESLSPHRVLSTAD